MKIYLVQQHMVGNTVQIPHLNTISAHWSYRDAVAQVEKSIESVGLGVSASFTVEKPIISDEGRYRYWVGVHRYQSQVFSNPWSTYFSISEVGLEGTPLVALANQSE